MNDSERDAWLREALRHAPDANAAPPSDVSETILAQARAAARAGGAPARAARSRNPVLALWDWLAKPPVAAGFASVMVATLVGLLWWDRPIDETASRAEMSSAQQRAQVDRYRADNRAIVGDAGAPAAASPAAPQAPSVATTPAPQPARQQRNEDLLRGAEKAPANAAKVEVPEVAAPPPPPSTVTVEAKEQQRKLETLQDATRADAARTKPAPFPRSVDERAALAATPAKKSDGDAKDSKASDRALDAAPVDALAKRDAALAKSLPAPAAPAEVLRSEPPAAFARERANEPARTSPSRSVESEAAKRGAVAGAMSQAAEAPVAPATMPAAAPPAAPPTRRDAPSTSGASDKQMSATAPSQQAQAQDELAVGQLRSVGVTPLAPILAALATEPSRWSRSTGSGNVVALEAGWRDWLAQLDAAARGRWQPSAAADDRERDGAATLRLVDGGRTAAVVRLDGTTVRIEAVERGERWQATLPPAAAERLRAAAERLGR